MKQYLIGNTFTLKTDHKPLLSIFGENKGIPIMAAARLQRWAFILSGLSYKIEYVKGLSNHAPSYSTFVNFVKQNNILSLDFKDVAREIRRYPTLAKVCESVKQGNIRDLKGKEFEPFTARH